MHKCTMYKWTEKQKWKKAKLLAQLEYIKQEIQRSSIDSSWANKPNVDSFSH